MENKNTNDTNLTMSDEDRLICDDEELPQAVFASPHRANKLKRQNIVDANRLRAQSPNDISRLTQSTSSHSFGVHFPGAITNCTSNSAPNESVGVGEKPNVSLRSLPLFGTPLDGAVNASTLIGGSNPIELVSKMHFIAGDSGTSQGNDIRPANLNDVKQIMATNESVINSTSTNTNNTSVPLLAQQAHRNKPVMLRSEDGAEKDTKQCLQKRQKEKKTGKTTPMPEIQILLICNNKPMRIFLGERLKMMQN